MINEFSKVEGYKIKAQKSVAFVYTNNEVAEREIKENLQLHQNKLPRNKFKEVKGLYSENCKTLMKEIKDFDINQ